MNRNVLIGVILAALLIPTTTAHDWQRTIAKDDVKLNVNTDPVTPVAGENVTFVAAIDHDNASLPDGLTRDGSVVNAEALITITTPEGSQTTTKATIPADDPHFTFSHRFTDVGDHTVRITLAERSETTENESHGDHSTTEALHEITTFDIPVSIREPNIAVQTSIAAETAERVRDDMAKTRSAVTAQQDTLTSLQTTVNDQGATLTRLKEQLEEQNSMIAFQRWTTLASLLIILSVFIRDLTQE